LQQFVLKIPLGQKMAKKRPTVKTAPQIAFAIFLYFEHFTFALGRLSKTGLSRKKSCKNLYLKFLWAKKWPKTAKNGHVSHK